MKNACSMRPKVPNNSGGDTDPFWVSDFSFWCSKSSQVVNPIKDNASLPSRSGKVVLTKVITELHTYPDLTPSLCNHPHPLGTYPLPSILLTKSLLSFQNSNKLSPFQCLSSVLRSSYLSNTLTPTSSSNPFNTKNLHVPTSSNLLTSSATPLNCLNTSALACASLHHILVSHHNPLCPSDTPSSPRCKKPATSS
jgi:hypothetical protein